MGYNNVDVMVSGPNKPSSTYKTKVLKGNHSFASQVTEANTKYVIKHDFDLKGESVTIPESCLLEFDGGSISNGTLVGQNTGIQAGLIKIFNTGVTIAGNWKVAETYPEWFGALGDNVNDDAIAINKILEYFKKIKLSKDLHCFTSINMPQYSSFDLNNYILFQHTNILFNLSQRNHIHNGKIKVYKRDAECTFFANTSIATPAPDTPFVNVLVENIDITDKKDPFEPFTSQYVDFKFIAEEETRTNFYYGITLSNITAIHFGAFAFVQSYGLVGEGGNPRDTDGTWVTGLDFINCSPKGHNWFYFFRKEKDLSVRDNVSRSPARVNLIGGELQPNSTTVAHMYLQSPVNARIYNTNWDVSTTISKCYIVYNKDFYRNGDIYDGYVQNYPYTVNTIGEDNLGTITPWGWYDERKLLYFVTDVAFRSYCIQPVTSTGFGSDEIIDLGVSFFDNSCVILFRLMSDGGLADVAVGYDRYTSTLVIHSKYKFYRSSSTKKLYIKKLRRDYKTALIPLPVGTGTNNAEPLGDDPNDNARGASFNYIKTIGKALSYVTELPEDAIEIVYNPKRNDQFIEGDDGKTYRLRLDELGNIVPEYTWGAVDSVNNPSSPIASYETDEVSFNTRIIHGGEDVIEGDNAEILNIKGNSIISGNSLVNSDITGLKITGKPEWNDVNWINEVSFVSIISSYFPNGLRKAGSVYDEIDCVRKKAIKRISSVDLGSLTWVVNSYTSEQGFFYTDEGTFPNFRSDSRVTNCLCVGYTAASPSSYASINKSITLGAHGRIYIHDTQYQTAHDLKTALNGVILNYETLVVTEYNIEGNFKFKIETGGIEAIVPSNTTVQPGFVIRYKVK